MNFSNIFLPFENKMIKENTEYYLTFNNNQLQLVFDEDKNRRGIVYGDYLDLNTEILTFKVLFKDNKFSLVSKELFFTEALEKNTGFNDINELLNKILIEKKSLKTNDEKMVKTDVLMFSVELIEKMWMEKETKKIYENKTFEEIMRNKYNIFFKDIRDKFLKKLISDLSELLNKFLLLRSEMSQKQADEIKEILSSFMNYSSDSIMENFKNEYTNAVFFSSYGLLKKSFISIVDELVEKYKNDKSASDDVASELNKLLDKFFDGDILYSFYITKQINSLLGVEYIRHESVMVLDEQTKLIAKNKARLDKLLFDIPNVELNHKPNRVNP